MKEEGVKDLDKPASTDPGGARLGNFINYYQFNPPIQRLSHIPSGLLDKFEGAEVVGLDIGCNSGDLTVALKKHLTGDGENNKTLHILGVDVDPELVKVAQRDHKNLDKDINSGSVSFDVLNLLDEESHLDTVLGKYLRTQKPSGRGGCQFDVVFCFSVTMWIHLNHGDQGLRTFFERLGRWCGKYLVIEPQPWKCYRTASRRMRKLKLPDFDQLQKMEPQSEEELRIFMDGLCTQNGFRQIAVFGETENWKRRIILYEKQDQS